MCVRARARTYRRVCGCVRLHVGVCVVDGEGSSVFASRDLAVLVSAAVYVTVQIDCLTGFREPLSPSYRCHTGFKNVQGDHCL